MKKDTSIQVIYIAGNGHSGSTLAESFSASHMLAGNALRLKINPEIGFQYKKLDSSQMKLAKVMDTLFGFWS